MIKKRGAVLAAVVLMLSVAVYLNWSYTKGEGEELLVANQAETGKTLGEAKLVDSVVTEPDETAVAETTAQDSYFAQARLSREQARDEALTMLKQSTLEMADGSEGKDVLAAQVAELATNAVREVRVESLVKSKGFDECLAFISSDSVSVIVPKQENGLDAASVAKIRDIVLLESDVKAENIKIVEAES